MFRNVTKFAGMLSVVLILCAPAKEASAWWIYEVFSNADGVYQFIQMISGDSSAIAGLRLVANNGSQTHSFTFPSDLPGGGGRPFLVATEGFASLNIIQPDYVVPNGFLFLSSGSLELVGTMAEFTYTGLPANGLHAMWADDNHGPNVIAQARAENFAGYTTIVRVPVVAGCDSLVPTNNDVVEHYYATILRRPSDAAGKAFWMGEADRLCALDVDPRQTLLALADVFFNSAEYAQQGRDDSGFITDLYVTLFDRLPEAGGLDYWLAQLSSGMPRNNVLSSFLFSPEFTSTMVALFPGRTARAETYLVLNFYGGLFRRLAESGEFTYWVEQIRTAQCSSSPATAVQAAIDSASRLFVTSAEYAARASSNSQYVVDLYYALLQRGAEIGGYNYWVGQLNGGLLTREQVRQQFLASPEMTAQSAAIVAQRCPPFR